MKCVSCGSNSLVEGSIIETSGAGTSMFQPKGVSLWKKLFGAATRRVRAYGCIRCQHLQLAVEFSDEDLIKYQQFEDDQPGLLDRINTEPIKEE